jgi:predicted RNA-binding protein with PIN domain
MREPAVTGARSLLIDAMNVIGSRPDGWWRDRDGAVRRLARALATLAAADDVAVTLVVDGRPQHRLPEGLHHGIEVVYARRGGRDAADDRIVELLESGHPADEVVTADRELRDRVAARGVAVTGPRALWDRLDELGPSGAAEEA